LLVDTPTELTEADEVQHSDPGSDGGQFLLHWLRSLPRANL
jgi:hypothetical protein